MEGTHPGDNPTTMDSIVRAVAKVETQPVPLASGQVLDGTYELVERIGSGGMGVVYRARDRHLGRDVAVKVLKVSTGEQGEHRRMLFEREARATAQLLHPNIVTLHHVGEQGGHPYLVLELLAGETLATRLARKGKLPVLEALAILDAILAALTFAHERGVLHRDLKPNNVFVTVDDRVKVLDFGVALSLDTHPGPATRSAGTPGYMAPEQAAGGDQDVRTDVWSAALLLLECLLGRRPDDRDAVAAAAKVEAPGPIRAELERALASDPAKRPATASELRHNLARAAGRLNKEVTPRRWIGSMLAIGLIAAALAAALTAFVVHDPRPHGVFSHAEISGSWLMNYGPMQLQVEPDGTVYGVYEHDEGILVGRYENDVITGVWCELPTRRGPSDAGHFEARFARANDRLLLEGRWRYGDSPSALWQPDFVGFALTTPNVVLEQRIQRRLPCP